MICQRSYKYFSAIIIFASLLTGCSSKKEEQPVKYNEVRVLFSYDGFCGVGYNDIILKAIDQCANTYGFEYSFFVPETSEDGMNDYRNWLNAKKGDNIGKSLYLFASNIYESLLEKESHPNPKSGKEILLFESEKELPYAYTFSMSYYGASYCIAKYYQTTIYPNCRFAIIAANEYMDGLTDVENGYNDAIEDFYADNTGLEQSSTIAKYYLGSDIGEGFNKQDTAFGICMMIDQEVPDEDKEYMLVYVPFAGASNLGVYRYANIYWEYVVGVDIDGESTSYMVILSMVKRMDLALKDFFEPWTNNKEIPRKKFYTLESGRVEVVHSTPSLVWEEERYELLKAGIEKEKKYFKGKITTN